MHTSSQLYGILSYDEEPSDMGCTYTLDKDWWDVDWIAPATPVGDSLQKFIFPFYPDKDGSIAAPEGFDINWDNGDMTFFPRDQISETATFAIKVDLGDPIDFQLFEIAIYIDGEDPKDISIIGREGEGFNIFGFNEFIEIPNSCTLIINIGKYDFDYGGIPINCIIPEIDGEVRTLNYFYNLSNIENLNYGIALTSMSNETDVRAELITDSNALLSLMNRFNFGYVTKTLCGDDIHVNVEEPYFLNVHSDLEYITSDCNPYESVQSDGSIILQYGSRYELTISITTNDPTATIGGSLVHSIGGGVFYGEYKHFLCTNAIEGEESTTGCNEDVRVPIKSSKEDFIHLFSGWCV